MKDFGKVFPGHGGVLDRFDSLIYAGAVFYIIVQLMQLFVIGVVE
ncbi:MAG TPA: phosphatidate cytidylyltransferase [Bacilli bacterium]|nr:phosphatidate cytidylyltransferase [Bacilli bacterium]